MMPEMDGLTLCRKIKQNVNLNHIPVILLTAKTREEDNLEGLETGADAYMTKPFHIEILRKTTANLIRSRERLRNTYTGQQTQGDKVQPIEVQSPDDKLMERIIRVINENLSNPNLTVEMITTEVGISRVHLHRKLKELTNQTTRDFIRNIRLKQAAELLSKKRYTIAEVADLTGFTNPNNFSTAFKDLYGMPPSMYMEQHLKQDKNKEEN
jgi:Bacterial regulatory helix-turn-helix proteins, AraC family